MGGIPWWGRPWAAKITAGCWADWKEPCGRAELRHRGLFDEGCLHFYAGALGDERSDADTELLRRLLELQPGMEVLDLACGHGRIANRLAARGCRVTGLDATPLFLDLACRDATDRGVAVEYVQGDAHAALDRPLRPGHQLVHAFGYFNDAGNRQVLAEVPAPSSQEDALPWRCSTATGLSAPCSRPWSWSATVTCWWTGTGSSS